MKKIEILIYEVANISLIMEVLYFIWCRNFVSKYYANKVERKMTKYNSFSEANK